MSYEIVKSITINEQEGKVFIKYASNNCFPHTYTKEEYPYFSKILQEKGLQETEIAILKEFESGNLQSSLNLKYTRALKVLNYLFSEEYKRVLECEDRRKGEEFKELLLKALNTPLPKEKFIIKKLYGIEKREVYVKKETSRHIFYGELSQAKTYDFKQQAEPTAQHINGIVITKEHYT